MLFLDSFNKSHSLEWTKTTQVLVIDYGYSKGSNDVGVEE